MTNELSGCVFGKYLGKDNLEISNDSPSLSPPPPRDRWAAAGRGEAQPGAPGLVAERKEPLTAPQAGMPAPGADPPRPANTVPGVSWAPPGPCKPASRSPRGAAPSHTLTGRGGGGGGVHRRPRLPCPAPYRGLTVAASYLPGGRPRGPEPPPAPSTGRGGGTKTSTPESPQVIIYGGAGGGTRGSPSPLPGGYTDTSRSPSGGYRRVAIPTGRAHGGPSTTTGALPGYPTSGSHPHPRFPGHSRRKENRDTHTPPPHASPRPFTGEGPTPTDTSPHTHPPGE